MSDDTKKLAALARSREWKARNKERVAEYRKGYYAANKLRDAEVNKRWLAKNPDRAAEYRKRHAPYVRDWQAVRKAARTGLPVLFSPAAIRQAYANECWACGCSEGLSMDHIIPLSRGGSNLAFNLRTLCAACNRGKNTRMDHEVRDLGLRARLLMGFRAMEAVS